MNLPMTRRAVAVLASLAAVGCASINSTPTTAPGDGLVYYMPKKNILVKVDIDAAKTSATIETTAAYPDLERPFVLNFNRNWVGKNELNVGIGTTGLLTTAKSTTTSGIAEAFKNLASSIGTLHGMAAAPPVVPPCVPGSVTYMLDATDATHRPCQGLTIRVQRLAVSQPSAAGGATSRMQESSTGIFYRQQEAFRVDVLSNAPPGNTSSIVLSPSSSPVRFLPIEKTLFANNKADFAFVDGVPTKYDQEAEGELIGLFKLPADVIGAYFAAIGNVFGSLKTTREAESGVLTAEVKLELAKLKHAACMQAVQNKDAALQQQLECGK